MKALRTPDERFVNLPGYPYQPHYVEVPSGDGGTLRMHFVDEGPRDAEVVLMLHGEPSWSYLYRKVIDVVVAAGLRAVAPDLIGFGRSDKPTERADYSYQRHVDWMDGFLRATALPPVTLLCQDWGGLIGLRLCGEQPERFARVVAANTFLPTRDRSPGEAFFAWRKFSQEIPEFPTGGIIKGATARELGPGVREAYDAPFPDESYQAGARQFPLLVPASPDDPAAPANRAAWAALAKFERPFLTAFGDSDPVTRGADGALHKHVAGAQGQPHTTIARAGHFLQEDAGEELGRIVVDFVGRTK